jgi:hypothetical protein
MRRTKKTKMSNAVPHIGGCKNSIKIFMEEMMSDINEDVQSSKGKRDQTGDSAEFYVLATLRRLDIDAHLTLANKKAVDIIVIKDGCVLTIDVKGLQVGTSFQIGKNMEKITDKNHYFVFVYFGKDISDIGKVPPMYVVPAKDLLTEWSELDGKALATENKGGNNVLLSDLKKLDKCNYLNNFDCFK